MIHKNSSEQHITEEQAADPLAATEQQTADQEAGEQAEQTALGRQMETVATPEREAQEYETVQEEQAEEEATEPPCKVLIHNDDVTPYEYVIYTLGSVFMLSDELADHVAWTAHNKGEAVVVVRPRREAEKLVKVAAGRARGDGFPLTFTLEND